MRKGKPTKAPAKASRTRVKSGAKVAIAAPTKQAKAAARKPLAKPARIVKKSAPSKTGVKVSQQKLKPGKSAALRVAASAKRTTSAQVVKKAGAVAKPLKAAAVKVLPGKSGTPDGQASKSRKGDENRMSARIKPSAIVLPPDYRPSEDEPFMSERHRIYFRQRLLAWKDEILQQTRDTIELLHEDSAQHADLADRATSETDRALELRARDRQRKLIAKIDAALGRIEDGSYGYCEETGEPIGLKRLDARPIATLSLEAQERHERREKVYREE